MPALSVESGRLKTLSRTQAYGTNGIDPATGSHFDDTLRYIDSLDISVEDRHKVLEGNARRAYPRLDAQLKARGR